MEKVFTNTLARATTRKMLSLTRVNGLMAKSAELANRFTGHLKALKSASTTGIGPRTSVMVRVL